MERAKAKKVLLHSCCGPCVEYPLQDLQANGFEVHLYYFNPNIQPQVEFDRRLKALIELSEIISLPLYWSGQADISRWRLLEEQEEDRCLACYQIRLEETARFAKENNFDFFSTTLLVSPYQKSDLIMSLGHELAKKYGLKFLARDWREGFRQGQKLARERGLYRQRYCGCLFSIEDSKFKDKIKKEHQILAENKQDSV